MLISVNCDLWAKVTKVFELNKFVTNKVVTNKVVSRCNVLLVNGLRVDLLFPLHLRAIDKELKDDTVVEGSLAVYSDV